MSSDIAGLIRKLETNERAAVDLLEARLDAGDLRGRLKRPLDLIKVYFRFDGADPSLSTKRALRFFCSTHDENKDRWANAADGVPVIRQLITDPHLVVDLKAVQTEEECISAYGLTSEQLYQLAAKDFVRFNLYEFDSSKDHVDGPFAPYAASECKYMDALLDPSEGWCRITSIRKEAFFNRLVGGDEYSYSSRGEQDNRFRALIEEGKDRFGPLIRTATKEERERMGLRQIDPIKAIEITARHFAYVQAVIEGSNTESATSKVAKAKRWLDRVKGYGDEGEKKVKAVRHIKGLKNLIATDYTASMGGTYNMGAHTLGPYLDLREFDGSEDIQDIQGQEDRESVDEQRHVRLRKADEMLRPIHEFVEHVQRERLATDKDVPAPTAFKSQDDFIGYLERVIEPLSDREAQNRISDLTVALAKHAEEGKEKIETVHDLLKARQEAFEMAKREQQGKNIVFDMATVFIGAITTAATGIPIVANLITQLFGTLTDDFRDTEAADLMSESKRNLVARMEGVEDIYGVNL